MVGLVKIKRNNRTESRYHRNMGRLKVRVTRIQKTFLGVPYKTLHKYRETYHGRIKDCDDCILSDI